MQSSALIHTDLFIISVPNSVNIIDENGAVVAIKRPVDIVMQYLNDCGVGKPIMCFQFDDNCDTFTVLHFTTNKMKVETHINNLMRLQIGRPYGFGDVNAIPLSIAKDYRSSFESSKGRRGEVSPKYATASISASNIVPTLSEIRNQSRFSLQSLHAVHARRSSSMVPPPAGLIGNDSIDKVFARKIDAVNHKISIVPTDQHVKTSRLRAFAETVHSRISVQSMLVNIRDGSELTFDYVVLISVAAILALIGLITNSSVIIVAAMLVSPMMGPIMGFTFGFIVRDKSLIKVGIVSEGAAFIICSVVGFIGGICAAPLNMQSAPWPTAEMESRTTVAGLYNGAAIALVSGVGVTLSITGQNTSSLVGVAISASLLPPIVNFGLFLAQATLLQSYAGESCKTLSIDDENIWRSCCSGRTPLTNLPYRPTYNATCDSLHNYAFPSFCCSVQTFDVSTLVHWAFMSLALCLINIVCIWFAATLMFYVKRTVPLPQFLKRNRKYDVQISKSTSGLTDINLV